MDPSFIFLDHASTSYPKPPDVLEGIAFYMHHIGASPGRGGHTLAAKADDLVDATRERLAEFLGIRHPSHIAFTLNATHSLNILIKGFLKPGDHALISPFEHNAVLRPLHKLSLSGGITYTVFKSDKLGNIDLEDAERKIQPNTKLLIVNHASNVIGVVNPIMELCSLAKKHGIAIALDISQTAGILPIDAKALDADFIAGTGHKGLLGPSGVGFLYAKDPDLIDSLYEGGSGVNALSRMHPEASPVKFEAGTLNYLGISGLYSSLGYLMRVGRETIYKRCMHVTQEALNQLESLPGINIYGTKQLDRKVPIISFNASGYFSTEAAYLLNEHKIAVRAGLHCAPLAHEAIGTAPHGTIRASFGHLNSIQDVGRLTAALEIIVTKISKQNPPKPQFALS